MTFSFPMGKIFLKKTFLSENVELFVSKLG
jgi:hypothetical protein